MADTHPTNPLSIFELKISETTDMTVSWGSSSNRRYALSYATNLLDTTPWAPIPQMTNVPGTGGIIVYTNLNPDIRGFFRATVFLPE
tara:strand:+ start:255 stop:515 length:261 start_codon:yes stop_codon:yes gene_type:complete